VRLNRLCLKIAGKTAFEMTQERLMLEACRKLTYVPAGVAGIAYELGFQDPAYFSRLFKKLVGMTPKEYRFSASSSPAPPYSIAPSSTWVLIIAGRQRSTICSDRHAARVHAHVHRRHHLAAEVLERHRDRAQAQFQFLVDQRIALRAGARDFEREALLVDDRVRGDRLRLGPCQEALDAPAAGRPAARGRSPCTRPARGCPAAAWPTPAGPRSRQPRTPAGRGRARPTEAASPSEYASRYSSGWAMRGRRAECR
jgi:hypothetical protein